MESGQYSLCPVQLLLFIIMHVYVIQLKVEKMQLNKVQDRKIKEEEHKCKGVGRHLNKCLTCFSCPKPASTMKYAFLIVQHIISSCFG